MCSINEILQLLPIVKLITLTNDVFLCGTLLQKDGKSWQEQQSSLLEMGTKKCRSICNAMGQNYIASASRQLIPLLHYAGPFIQERTHIAVMTKEQDRNNTVC